MRDKCEAYFQKRESNKIQVVVKFTHLFDSYIWPYLISHNNIFCLNY